MFLFFSFNKMIPFFFLVFPLFLFLMGSFCRFAFFVVCPFIFRTKPTKQELGREYFSPHSLFRHRMPQQWLSWQDVRQPVRRPEAVVPFLRFFFGLLSLVGQLCGEETQ